uniref:Uncharacterized LOC111664964 n=1 Tax=Seriola lalandi dorsalis TaxID=1841481 RepID=A0A3B4XW92_SERLL
MKSHGYETGHSPSSPRSTVTLEDLQCATCLAHFNNKASLRAHQKLCMKRDSQAVDCKTEPVENNDTLTLHQDSMDVGKQESSEHLTLKTEVINETDSRELKTEDQTGATDLKYKCKKCDRSFSVHENRSSTTDNQTAQNLHKYECSDCGMSFSRRTRLFGHMRVHRSRRQQRSKPPRCDQCNKDFSSMKSWLTSQLSLQCMECHIIFSDHKSKERHLKLSHPAQYEQCILRNALFACYVCDRHFTNSTELMAHQKAHTEKKPFKCPICGLAFNKSSELTLHKKIHFGRDGYACTDCGKPCKTLTLLKYHRRTHTGERPYVCKECGKRFTMSKALQKHILSHLPEGAEDEGNTTAKQNKTDGASAVKYSCSICKANFKTTKTRLHHMKTKHNVPAAASNAFPPGQQVKQSTPIITPISISQPALLQVEPNGPLQKVDANIDTEQIRRLIESLGNVQKVNQVVILGQVPPHAPPLEVQQISQLAEPVTLNLSPPQIDFLGLKQSESKTVELDTLNNQCNSLEQTIILEPITPDGQLENPSFSELGSNIAASENIELTLVQTEQTEQPQGEMMHQILQQTGIGAIHSDPADQMVCQNEVADLKQNFEQTVILELTPALIPTLELEQSQTVPQNEIPASSLVPTTELEKTPDLTPHPTVIDEQETSLSIPPFMPTVELELTPLQTEQQDLTSCSFVPPDTLTQTPSESETNPKEEVDTQMQTVSLDQVHHVMDEAAPQETQEKAEQEPSEQEPPEKLLVDSKEGEEQLENQSQVEETSAKEEAPLQVETKQVPQISELPINVMSAQELVKVRKRKTLQQQQQQQQQHQPTQEEEIRTNLSDRKAASQKKGRKGKRKVGHLVSTAEIKSPSSTQDPQVKQIKEDTKKNKIKRQKEEVREGVTHISEHKTVASPVFKKKKQGKIMRKDQTKNAKDGKRKKNLSKEEKVNTKKSTDSADIPGPHIKQDSLLLLKGHKQPQLKVYKLDPSKTSGQTPETPPHEFQTMSQQSKDNNHPTNDLTAESKKKGGRPKKNQKALSLLSSLHVSPQPPEALPTKPKTTRKRKASSKVETEGIITSSHSKRALECNDCGERFSEVSSLQKHKATVHIIESPGLTYTNGNVFEGVSRVDLYQLPKHHDKVVGVINAAADWDTEPEMGEMALEDRERTLSFPALIPSPSLPVPPPEVEVSAYEDKGGSKAGADDQSHTSPEVHSPSDQLKNTKISPNFTSESALSTSTQTKKSEVQATADEDIKEDLLLEVDLVTVGEQNERDDPASPQETPEQTDETTAEKSLTLQTVSCSTHQVEIKEEEEEMLVQRKKEGEKGGVTRNATRDRRQGTGHLKRDAISKIVLGGDTVRGTESDKEQDECHVVYEKNLITSDSEIHYKGETPAPATCLASVPSTLEESPEEQVVLELESVTPSVQEVMNEGELQGGEEHGREADQSPGIILEKFLTSETADKELCLMTAKSNQRQMSHAFGLLFSVMESVDTISDCYVTPEFNTNQCIFYPVKEEEREVLLGDTQISRGSLTPEGSCAEHQTEPQTADSTLSESLCAHLLIMFLFFFFLSLMTSTRQLQAPRDANRTREPIDYFAKYFGWDTWVEIASCTNKLSCMSNPVIAREVAQFVGIHIAMGTLKFPSPRLYWEDLTKVPLIAEAMPLSRFLQLSCMLKLASPPNDLNSSKTQTDPLWKVQPLLCRFKAGCQSLTREGDYAVDQYPLPLTGKMHNNKLSLHCTTLIGFGGLLLHVDLKPDLSDKENAVEKMAPRGSMLFLCKQELSTPAMLERLLVAGVHGAGRVGGARGQIGDEFVSSDGKLMLRRSHCGFILSTAGNGQRDMASLTDNFEKAQMSARLSRDLRNLYPIPLTASAPTCWPQAVLWYLIDLALVNSWLLYRQDHRAAPAPLTLMAFRLEVSKALILSSGSDTQDSVPPQPPTEKAHTTNETPNPSLVEESPLPDAATRYDGSGHWPEQLAEGEGGRCRFGDCQRTSRVLCLKCCVFLCISRNHNCFLNFHNQGSLVKE